MYLLSLFILFLLFGWILASTRFNRKVDEAAGNIAAATSRFNHRLRSRWQSLSSRRQQKDEFRLWALGRGAPLFPDDFKSWLAGLSEDEARRFHTSLSGYSRSLGFEMADLLDGSLDQDPILRQVFVEAVVVYSPAYRRARQAKRTAAEGGHNGAHTADPERRPAEKSPSRRKQPAGDNTEAAPAA